MSSPLQPTKYNSHHQQPHRYHHQPTNSQNELTSSNHLHKPYNTIDVTTQPPRPHPSPLLPPRISTEGSEVQPAARIARNGRFNPTYLSWIN